MEDEQKKHDRNGSPANLISTVILVAALLVGGYVAYTNRPWSDSSGESDSQGLLGAEPGTPRPGHPAPDFVLQRADGSTLQLSDLQGKPVFLNFWATWCTFCLEEMPDMQRIAEEFDDQLVVVGVNAGDSIAQGKDFADRLGAAYELVYDTKQDVVRGYNVRAMPTSYFIGSDGTVEDAHFGFMTYDDMHERVTNLITSSD